MLSDHEPYRLPPRVIETIASSFKLGHVRQDGVPTAGARYMARRLSTSLGDFALISPRPSSSRQIKREEIFQDLIKVHEIIQFLAERNFPVAAPLKTAKGSTIETVFGVPYALYPFVNGRPMARNNISQIGEAAGFLGRYHEIMDDFNHKSPLSEYFLPHQFQSRLDEFYLNTEALGSLGPTLDLAGIVGELENSLPGLESDIHDLTYHRLPRVTIHGDYRSPNLLFYRGKVAAIIDFHRSRLDARLLDVAIALSDLVIAAPNGNSLELARKFVVAYERVQPMKPIEKRALPVLTQARVAWRTFRRFRRISRSRDPAKRLRRARKFRVYAERLLWMRSTRDQWEDIPA